jgi:MoxR-vWA-beta-propeller ternary system domain bpX4
VAGPPPPFDPDAAASAAGRVWCACWFLLHRADEPDTVEKALVMTPPMNASQHLSADLTLRFLPQVHRRARALAAADPMTACLGRLLREWPLSGVLSDVSEPPLTPPEFDGHKGLLMLYAERLAANVKPAWLPTGSGLPYVELAFADRGLTVPVAEPAPFG